MSSLVYIPRLRRVWLRALIFVSVALLGILVASTAFAAWTTISTTDNAIGSWGTAAYTSACGNGSLDNRYEIKNAWYTNDGSSIFFHIETCTGPALQGNTNLRVSGTIDCNNDGDFTDPYVSGPDGDRLVNYDPNSDNLALVTSTQNVAGLPKTYGEKIPSNQAHVEWKVDLANLYPACRGSTGEIHVALAVINVSTSAVWDQTTPSAGWAYNIPIDYGDLPDTPYTTLLVTGFDGANPNTTGGPRHSASSALKLGSLKDGDGGNMQDSAASLDDATNQDDEDGVTPSPGFQWAAGVSGHVDIVASGAGFVTAWVDFNGDGDFGDTGEKILSDRSVSAGLNANQTFSIPAGTSLTNGLYARFRIYNASTGGAASPTGAVENGEVEDYQWTFTPNAVTFRSISSSSSVSWGWVAAALTLALGAGLWLARRIRVVQTM